MSILTKPKQALRAEVKHAISSLLPKRQENDLRDICLFSNRRGGSTWIMETLCAHPGLRHIDQPFCSWTLAPHLLRKLPEFTTGPFDRKDESLVKAYFYEILAGKLNVNSRWDLWSRQFWQKPERMVIKLLAVKPMIEWFAATFPVDIVYQIRHPISQSLSIIRAGWGNEVMSDFLGNEAFVRAHLTSDQAEYAHRLMDEGSVLEQQVLEWCLDNLEPLRALDRHPEWVFVTYEQAILEPGLVIDTLSDKLKLPQRDAMRRQLAIPSKTAKITHSEVRADQLFNPKQVAQWRQEIGPEEEKRCLAILEKFEIDLYRFGQDAAADHYLLSSHTGGETHESSLSNR